MEEIGSGGDEGNGHRERSCGGEEKEMAKRKKEKMQVKKDGAANTSTSNSVLKNGPNMSRPLSAHYQAIITAICVSMPQIY
jgi:hypothetical protein